MFLQVLNCKKRSLFTRISNPFARLGERMMVIAGSLNLGKCMFFYESISKITGDLPEISSLYTSLKRLFHTLKVLHTVHSKLYILSLCGIN